MAMETWSGRIPAQATRSSASADGSASVASSTAFCCVHCGCAVEAVYWEYSPNNIRLMKCDACKQFADKYVEFEVLLILLDMILLKQAVYHHLLFNRDRYTHYSLATTLYALFPCCVLMHSIYKYLFLTGGLPKAAGGEGLGGCLGSQIQAHRLGVLAEIGQNPPGVDQGWDFFGQCVLATFLELALAILAPVVVVWASNTFFPASSSTEAAAAALVPPKRSNGPRRAHNAAEKPVAAAGGLEQRQFSAASRVGLLEVLRAVLLAHFGQLTVVLMLIWPYHAAFGLAVDIFVATSTSVCVRVLLRQTGVARSALLTTLGVLLAKLVSLLGVAGVLGLPVEPGLLLIQSAWRCM